MNHKSNYSDREKAVFNGIVKLLHQGRRIHELKVSDIALAAGIGKSTAYEYFTSKEEILIQAVRYHVIREFEAVDSFVSDQLGFLDLLNEALDYMVDMLGNRFSSLLMMFMSLESQERELLVTKDCELIRELQQGINDLFEKVRHAGVKDGLIGESISADESRFIIMGMLSAFFNEIRFGNLYEDKNKTGLILCRERTIRLLLKALQ